MGLDFSTDDFDANTPFEIPVFEDMYGDTAIDAAMGLAESGAWSLRLRKKKSQDGSES